MSFHFSMNAPQTACVILSFLFLVQGDTCAGEELSQGGDAPVTRTEEKQSSFQPVLKGPSQEEQDFTAAEYFFVQGRILEAQSRGHQALQCYERASQYVSSDTILVCLVTLALELKRYDEAARYFDKIQNTERLGFRTLNILSVLFARLDESARVVKSQRALLNSIPVNASGPLRMMIHESLGRAEYLDNHFPEAKRSLRAIQSMMKNPSRYGISGDELKYFKDREIANLCVLLDIAIHEENVGDARKYLAQLYILQEKELEEKKEAGLSEEEYKELKKTLELQKTFDSARISYVEKDLETALKLAKKAYSAGFTEEEQCYTLLRVLLEAQGHSEAYFETLCEFQKEQPENNVLKLSLAEEYELRALNADGETPRTEALNHAKALYEEVNTENELVFLYVPLIRIAVRQNKPEMFLKYAAKLCGGIEAENVFIMLKKGLLKSSDSVRVAGNEVENTAETEIAAESKVPAESEAAAESEAVAESAKISGENSAAGAQETANSEAGTLEAKEISDQLRLTEEEFTVFAQKTLQYAAENYASEEGRKKLEWEAAWVLAWLAQETKNTDAVTDYYHFAAASAVKQVRNEPSALVDAFFLYWGNYFCSEKNYSMAISVFQQAMKIKSSAHALFALSYVQALILENSHPEEAWKQVLALEAEEPENLDVQLWKSKCLILSGNPLEAKKVLQTLIAELDNNYSAEINREILPAIRQELAGIEENEENFDAAIENVSRILDEFPDDVSGKNTLAYFWACKNTNLHRALRYSMETLEAEPENAMYQDTLGWIYYRLGEYEKALALLTQAAGKMQDPVVFSHLGDVYLALNQKEKAIEFFKQSLQQFQELATKNQVESKDLKHVQAQLNLLKVS